MRIHNFLPVFNDCITRWEELPSYEEFQKEYYYPLCPWLDTLFADFGSRLGTDFYGVLKTLDWKKYRERALGLDPVFEENRVRRTIQNIEKLFGFPLEGDVILFSAFACMDGYARFHKGNHCVYLGLDEEHGPSKYLDILIAHELTHVARESRATVWEGFGLNPLMTHDEFVDSQPVIEHLMGEGFSCAISEILVPNEDAFHYCYQNKDSLRKVFDHGERVDRRVHEEIEKPDGMYRALYSDEGYGFEMPRFCHYVWAWQWAKQLIALHGGDVKKLVGHCSKDFISNALKFELKKSSLY